MVDGCGRRDLHKLSSFIGSCNVLCSISLCIELIEEQIISFVFVLHISNILVDSKIV